MTRRTTSSGFTLIELSIVLVIIGLVVGGVLVGRDLIRAAELQSVITDVNKITTAVNTFRGKYNALPGDMTNATAIWGSAGGDSGDNYTDSCAGSLPASGTLTCNGNGDGEINPLVGSLAGQYLYESFTFWQHLSLEGLVPGRFSGASGSGGPFIAMLGVNVLPSRISNGGYTPYYLGTFDGTPAGNEFLNDYGTTLAFGSVLPGSVTVGPVITPSDAFNIDRKIDDGQPAFGKVVTLRPNAPLAPGCSTSDTPTAAQYAINTKMPVCMLHFITGME